MSDRIGIPSNWIRLSVGELFGVVGGGTPATGEMSFWKGRIPWISSANIDSHGRVVHEKYVTEAAISSSAANLIPPGSVIVVTRVGLGKVALAPTEMCFSQDCQALLFKPEHFDPSFVAHQMRWVAASLAGEARGTTISGVTKKSLLSLRFSLPPRKEQTRIVEAVEGQLTTVEAAARSLRRAQRNLKRYRSSVLKAACEGRLVPTEAELARQEGRDYEPADVLLERILAERRVRWEAEEVAKFARAGKKLEGDGWRRRYKEPVDPDGAPDVPLPEGWSWTSLGRACEVFVGATPSRARPEYWDGSIPWVSSGEVAFCRIRRTREMISEQGLAHTSTTLHPPGTVLIGMIGEGRTRGQVAILDIEACNNQNCAAIRIPNGFVVSEYLYSYLAGQYEQTRRIGSGNNQPALNKTRVENLRFPLPPVAEQVRIVAEVERRFSCLDSLIAAVDLDLRRAERLRQSILKRAFEGKLVPQDPNDEPASVLLDRIRAEREAAPRQTRKRGRRRAAAR